MARLGLKKQGRQWGLFHGSELVSGSGSSRHDGSPMAAPDWWDGVPADQQPEYDNDTEYGDVRAVLEEAKHHPPLETAARQREREELQRRLERALAAFEAKHRRGRGIHWDAEAENELHELMLALDELLGLVGISLHHV